MKNTVTGDIKFNPVYFTTIKELQPFKENDETSEIILWDLQKGIGYIDGVDIKILDYI